MLLRVSQTVHRKILQADILLGSTEETRVLVPAKIVVNWGKESPKMAVEEDTADSPQGNITGDMTFLLVLPP